MNVSDPLNMLAPDGTTRRRKEDSLSMRFEKHDDRLKHLENTKSTIYGIAAAIGALSAFLMDGLRAAILQR
jgi:hypothetical protein